MKLPPLILASASPRRADLLRQLKLDFEIVPSDVPEVFDDHLSPLELCELNAHRKARAVAKKIPDALVLGADTLVFLNRKIFGKPASVDEAREMLAQLQGRMHRVVTGVSLIHLRAHTEKIFAESTDVMFHPLTPEQIGEYITRVNPLDKAGAYAIQEGGESIVSEISGSFSNVMGLPIERVREELDSWPNPEL